MKHLFVISDWFICKIRNVTTHQHMYISRVSVQHGGILQSMCKYVHEPSEISSLYCMMSVINCLKTIVLQGIVIQR